MLASRASERRIDLHAKLNRLYSTRIKWRMHLEPHPSLSLPHSGDRFGLGEIQLNSSDVITIALAESVSGSGITDRRLAASHAVIEECLNDRVADSSIHTTNKPDFVLDIAG